MTIQSIMIDSREPQWMQMLRPAGIQPAVTALDAADVWVATADGQLLVIERKTVTDLLASIADGRLFVQAARMRELSPWAYVVVQGHLVADERGTVYAAGKPTRWQWTSLQGSLQTVQELGVMIVYIDEGATAMCDYIERLAGRDRNHIRLGAPRRGEMYAPQMLPLLGMPGIGDERAKQLIETFGTAAWAIEFLTDPHWDGEAHVPGIGAGIKRGVRAALGLPDDMKLCIRTLQE